MEAERLRCLCDFLIQALHEQMLDATLVESGCMTLDAVNFVALRKYISDVGIKENW